VPEQMIMKEQEKIYGNDIQLSTSKAARDKEVAAGSRLVKLLNHCAGGEGTSKSDKG